MAICSKCGSYVPDNVRMCSVCGHPVAQSADRARPAQGEVPNFTAPRQNSAPYYDTSPSVWWYIGMMLLFGIPVVGFICAIVIAFGTPNNRAKRNFAIAHLVILAVGAVLIAMFSVFIGSIIAQLPWEEWEREFYHEGIFALVSGIKTLL